ncbi:S8 family serine peptidase [Microbacterium sp. NPDC057650]|uniref:S8 family serine peptidase n=1 Tax=unclassified Microbacterium TaxID=2609290 RepID=UPI00366B0EF4
MQRSPAFPTRRRLFALATTAAVVLGVLIATPAVQAAPTNSDSGAVTKELEKQLAEEGTAPLWVDLRAEADLSDAAKTRNWRDRGATVVEKLEKTAADSQRGVIDVLDDAGVDYRSFYISNAVYVPRGSASLAAKLAEVDGVKAVRADHAFAAPEIEPAAQAAAVANVEWGIAAIKADKVWSDFGVQGEGIVIGSIDSGAQFDHPALVAQYRGNRGDGTFDHNYNWFNPTSACSTGVPCDDNGHGTHTIGTMVGDGAPGKKIGVAPAAQWIAAKGCEARTCPEAALLASAEFMLAPTDLTGHNPRPELRPHIVNNSWGGDNGTAVDLWFSDMIDAWTAAGIFPMFANGNAGPGCGTAGSPGDNPNGYSAGAFDSTGKIAAFSSRGSTEEPDIKPNIAAPGVAIRSAIPGSAYGSMNGTSMASPHVAAAVALMWSASPELARNVAETKKILDSTAVNVDDTSCGGTVEDNYTWGEGKLDALAAVTASPIRNTGTISGAVTNAADGTPVPGARIVIDGPLDRDLGVAADGSYSVRLTAGDYTVTASAFGYTPTTVKVTVADGKAADGNVKLVAAPISTVSGTVADDSGHGWPLYARIDIPGIPAGPWFTDPKTGKYSIDLPAAESYRLTVKPIYAGYTAPSKDVNFSETRTQDLGVPINESRCVAPGYSVNGLFEPFSRWEKPFGWTTTDETGEGGWSFDDPEPTGNRTPGGEGGFAILNSQFYQAGKHQDAYLVSPVVDLSKTTEPEIALQTQYMAPSFVRSTATIQLSLDRGKTWEDVWSKGKGTVTSALRLPIPQAAGHDEVQVRFHYTGTFDMWWEIDDVLIGEPACTTIDGGLVIGQVSDRNTERSIGNASVTVGKKAPSYSFTTPADPDAGDGLYTAFVPGSGEKSIDYGHGGYADQSVTVDVEKDEVAYRDVSLAAGRLVITPDPLRVSQGMNTKTVQAVTLTNDGTAPLTVRLGAPVAKADAGTAPSRGSAASGTPKPLDFESLSIAGRFTGGPMTAKSPKELGIRGVADGDALAGLATAGESGTDADVAPGDWQTLDRYPLNIMDPALGSNDGTLYSAGGFDGAGTTNAAYRYDAIDDHWSAMPSMAVPRQAAAGGFADGKFIVAAGWGKTLELVTTTELFDPKTGAWSTGAPLPKPLGAPGHAVLDGKLYLVGGCSVGNGTLGGDCGRDTVMVYDPQTDAWDEIAPYPVEVSHAVCGAVADKLYCAGGMNSISGEIFDDVYAYDPVYDHWSARAPLPQAKWGGEGAGANGEFIYAAGLRDGIDSGKTTNETYHYNPVTDTWRSGANLEYPLYRGGSTCGTYIVGGAGVGWPGMARTQQLPRYQDCGAGVPSWVTLKDVDKTLQPGESISVPFTVDSTVLDQPGRFTADLPVAHDTPYRPGAVSVDLAVVPPKDWGSIAVTTVLKQCTGDVVPVKGAYVEVIGKDQQFSRKSSSTGQVSVAIAAQPNVKVIASKDGLASAVSSVKVSRGATTTVTATLTPAGGCR